jgi:hypothetical protein
LDIDKVYYSGFWSQGDGACFEGKCRYQKGGFNAVKSYAPTDKTLHNIVKRMQDLQRRHFYSITAETYQRGHYYHSGCMHVDIGTDIDYSAEGFEAIEDTMSDILRDFSDWIYDRLEKVYEYINSDAGIIENIVESDYEFLKTGEIY